MTSTAPPALSPEDGLERFEAGAEAIVERLAAAYPVAPVPTCPGWTVADLILHLGGVHQWVCHAIVAGTPDGARRPPEQTDIDSLRRWYREQADTLATLLRATDPQQPVWHFGPKPRTASFWFVRQAHEVAIHRIDLAAAMGDAPLPLPDEAAGLDGIDEVVRILAPRQLRKHRVETIDPGVTIRVDDHRWVIGEHPAAEISGPASVLQPVLWGRIAPDDPRVRIAGDVDAVRNVLAAGIVP